MRTVVLRVVALAVLLLLVLAAVLSIQTMRRLPNAVIYYVASEGTTFRLEPVGRRFGSADPEERAREAVRELARGPGDAERRRGLDTTVPAGTEVESVDLEDGILRVDLSREFESGGGTASMQGRLHQLFYTLTQPADVEGVHLSIEGRPAAVFGGEGILVELPWLRDGHPGLPRW